VKAEQAEQVKNLKDARAAMAQLPADQRADLEAIITQTEAQANSPEMITLMRAGIENDRASSQQAYQNDLAAWQHDVPTDPMILVSRALHHFLDVSADVDFSAAVEASGTNTRFVKAEYEEKPQEWKMCFRAGKAAVTAARRDATAWLAELPQP
jgi:hypothetical protein